MFTSFRIRTQIWPKIEGFVRRSAAADLKRCEDRRSLLFLHSLQRIRHHVQRVQPAGLWYVRAAVSVASDPQIHLLYHFFIHLSHSSTVSPVFLISVRPSIKHSIGVTDDVAVTKGGNVTLQCAAEGIPRPAVTWLKDGRPLSGQHRAKILNEGRLLQIRNVKVSDTGRYTCTAVNVAGQADSRHDISVHGMTCGVIIIIPHFVLKLFMSLIPSLVSPTDYYRSGRSARECECGCEESNCSELRGLWHPSSCHQLVERWSSSQSFQLGTRPLRWLLSDPVAFLSG